MCVEYEEIKSSNTCLISFFFSLVVGILLCRLLQNESSVEVRFGPMSLATLSCGGCPVDAGASSPK